MTKFEVISQKPSKNWIFGQNGNFLTVFGQKWPIFEFFSKIRLEHFFTFPKPYLTAKFQKKLMNGCPDIAWRTYIRTSIQFHSINIPIKICIRWQLPCIITYSSTTTWAMMPWHSSYISLSDLHLPSKPKQWFITKTVSLPHRDSSTCDKNTAYVHLSKFILCIPNLWGQRPC